MNPTKLPAVLASALAMLAPALPAHADPVRMSEQQLAEVRGQAPFDLLGRFFSWIPADDIQVRWLDKTAFDAMLADREVPPTLVQGYNGGPVAQVSIAAPSDFSFNASQVLSAFGLHANLGSMGSFSVQGLDTSGLSLLVWSR